MAPFHIAILETDTPPESISSVHGSYGDVIEKALRRGLSEAGHPLQLQTSKWDVIEAQAYPSLGNVDAVFVTAGRHDADRDDPWVPRLMEFIRRAYAAKKPIMGICYGHQIIGRALGGRVARNPGGWEVTAKEIKLTPAGAELFGMENIRLHQMHRDAVVEAPPDVQIIGSSQHCEVQILYQPGRLLTTQGHAEFDALTCREMLEERRVAGILEGEVLEDAMAKVECEHDGAVFWRSVWRFLLKR